jgi:SHS2 domain-containing protein
MGGFELLAHTADVGVRARGATLEEAFEQATVGLAEVLGAWRPEGAARAGGGARGPGPGAGAGGHGPGGAGGTEAVAVDVGGGDLGGLLVDWLNEVLWAHEVRQHPAVVAVRVERVAGGRATGTVTFATAGPPADGTAVKAATYHRLRVDRDGDGWLAEVYLDV